MFVYWDVWFLPFSSMEPVAMLELHLCSGTIRSTEMFVLCLSFLSLLQRLRSALSATWSGGQVSF